MKPQKAIEILKRQRDKINDPKHPNNDTWKVQTASHIKDFFGESSDEYAHISQFSFSVLGHAGMSSDQWKMELNMNKRRISQFLDSCIETINDKGLYKPHKGNFLASLSDTWLSVIFVTVIPSLFLAGIWVGEYRSDVKNIELRQELKSVRDSLLSSTTEKEASKETAGFASYENDSNENHDTLNTGSEKN
jgi:hypothetical protein